jgi:hypothetical protein
MLRKSLILAIALLSSLPAFANTTQLAPGHASTAPAQPVLRLMNEREFSAFLSRLDEDLVRSESQLKKMDVKSLTPDLQAIQDLERSHEQCLQSLENTREEIQKLAQKQTLKLDLFLLIDLNELARNLDALDEVLVNPTTVNGTTRAVKSLGYAKQVLNMDVMMTNETSTFQHHFIAFTGVVDASMEQPDENPAQPDSQK